MLVNLIVYFEKEAPVSILTTDQAVLNSVHQIKNTGYFMVAGVREDCLVIPQDKIFSMAYTSVQVEQNENTKREGEGEKPIKPSKKETTRKS